MSSSLSETMHASALSLVPSELVCAANVPTSYSSLMKIALECLRNPLTELMRRCVCSERTSQQRGKLRFGRERVAAVCRLRTVLSGLEADENKGKTFAAGRRNYDDEKRTRRGENITTSERDDGRASTTRNNAHPKYGQC